jgi:hypothetical protein
MATSEDVPERLRFWWFEGEAIHFDAPRYARLRGIGIDEAIAELEQLARRVLPEAPIKTE